MAAIVIVAGIGLLDVGELRSLWRYRRSELGVALFTVVAVLAAGMLVGIVIAIALSLVLVVLRAAGPHTAELGRLPGSDTYRDVADHPEATRIPGLYLYRFDAPIFFANAARLRDEIVTAVDGREPPVGMVVIDAESIDDVDSSGVQAVLELLDELDRRSIGLQLARVRTEIRDELDRAGITSRLRAPAIHLEVDDAVAWFTAQG